MVQNVTKIHSDKVYLFETNNQESISSNALKDFLYFLRFKGEKNNIEFSYSSEEDSLHMNLSVKDNLVLDALPASFMQNGMNNLNEYLLDLNNHAIKDLILYIDNFNAPINKLSKRQIKIVSILKTLISNSKYIFLDKPDKHLNAEINSIVEKCLIYENEYNHRTILIKPFNNMLWPTFVTDIISKDTNQKKFEVSHNPLHKDYNESSPYSFTLNKDTFSKAS